MNESFIYRAIIVAMACASLVASADDRAGPQIDLGGQYRIMANSANFGWHPATVGSDEDTRSFFNQRFRTWLDVKADDAIGGHLQIEIGHVMWGEDDELTKTYGGDEVGVELRRGYVTYEAENLTPIAPRICMRFFASSA